ncbi:hypothetical protein R6231_14600 [Bacillus cytotoxicus]|uniref:hypothetical protein n=1 Tax=Bacillus cereus group TaxID=86661 RepID=UPI0019521D49|nr:MULTISPECIES: hypothetical protein [Bacillus cereus group]MDH2877616.1 hypothetical protein [Bacillus cytotoxicus]MDH2893723.1 hypothetical protein [Bacillus cytotoxicus]MDH2922663.1 hypothetical protein [Bacillus cytotoxicus]QTR69289.1 hypothetical protein JC776_21590 [Bacillus cytotoxicus]QTR77025.1 hypothetical protein JC772_21600 [Bacillus cytotoxicus]
MLDQNTDRTWWMIGAVVVGALLIAAAKVAFPEVFDSVKEFFQNTLTSATK